MNVDLLPVTDLKQWAYCERIVYYHHVMPAVGKATFKMKEAIAAQDLIERLEMRRGLHAYGLASAQRRFNLSLSNAALGLSGKIDLLLETQECVSLVDFKLTSGEVGENHRLQLAGYALLAEAAYALPATVAFLYRIPDNAVFPVEITQDLRYRAILAISAIRKMSQDQLCPPPTTVRAKCAECEYANYCADVW